MKKTLKLILATFLFIFFSTQVTAQRCLPGSSFIKGELVCTLSYNDGFGGSIGYGSFLNNSYWAGNFGMENRNALLSSGDRMDYTHFYVAGEWMYQVWTTRSRSLGIYFGAGAFVGYESYDTFNRLPVYYDYGIGKGAFLYGIYPAAECSLYVYNRLSVFGRFELPVQFAAPTGWVKYHLGLGLRYDFH